MSCVCVFFTLLVKLRVLWSRQNAVDSCLEYYTKMYRKIQIYLLNLNSKPYTCENIFYVCYFLIDLFLDFRKIAYTVSFYFTKLINKTHKCYIKIIIVNKYIIDKTNFNSNSLLQSPITYFLIHHIYTANII